MQLSRKMSSQEKYGISGSPNHCSANGFLLFSHPPSKYLPFCLLLLCCCSCCCCCFCRCCCCSCCYCCCCSGLSSCSFLLPAALAAPLPRAAPSCSAAAATAAAAAAEPGQDNSLKRWSALAQARTLNSASQPTYIPARQDLFNQAHRRIHPDCPCPPIAVSQPLSGFLAKMWRENEEILLFVIRIFFLQKQFIATAYGLIYNMFAKQ